jgi:hypothetical protein
VVLSLYLLEDVYLQLVLSSIFVGVAYRQSEMLLLLAQTARTDALACRVRVEWQRRAGKGLLHDRMTVSIVVGGENERETVQLRAVLNSGGHSGKCRIPICSFDVSSVLCCLKLARRNHQPDRPR